MPDQADPPNDVDLAALVPFAGHLGVHLEEMDATRVRIRLPWQDCLSTDVGTCHGGALMGLADIAGGGCAVLNLPSGSSGTTTIESKTNFLRPARGDLVAVAEPLHVGRSTIVVQTDIFDADGRRVARVTQTQAVLQSRQRL